MPKPPKNRQLKKATLTFLPDLCRLDVVAWRSAKGS